MVAVIFGELPNNGYGYGNGDGYGNGYGYGDGDGYGYGDGYGNGYGYGDGYGYGYGNGYGYGYGDGDGYGYGYGDGDGYGYDYGNGDGYGDGDGYGYGCGYGDSCGDGYGCGHGSKDYWLSCLSCFASKWTDAQRSAFDAAKKSGLQLAIWRSDKNGQPSNGGKKLKPAAPGVIHTAPGPLMLCEKGTLHATLLPPKWRGERWWVVALHGEVIGNEEKYGCLKREILGEAL